MLKNARSSSSFEWLRTTTTMYFLGCFFRLCTPDVLHNNHRKSINCQKIIAIAQQMTLQQVSTNTRVNNDNNDNSDKYISICVVLSEGVGGGWPGPENSRQILRTRRWLPDTTSHQPASLRGAPHSTKPSCSTSPTCVVVRPDLWGQSNLNSLIRGC